TFEGAEISLYYDPMIAKLVAYGGDRGEAADRLLGSLDGFYIAGVQHNVAFLAAIAASERFRSGRLSTDFIAETFPGGFAPPAGPVAADRSILAAAALAEARLHESETGQIPAARELTVLLDKQPCRIALRRDGAAWRLETGEESVLTATDWRPGQHLMHLRLDNHIVTVQIERLPGRAFRL